MRVDLSIELRDVPGELWRALKPVSETGGNIVSVVHHREKRTKKGTLPVELEIEVEEEKYDKIIQSLRERDINIINVGHERLRERLSLILIGHIVHTNLQETIDLIDSTGFAEVVNIELEMPGIDSKSTALIGIKTSSKEKSKEVLKLLEDIAEKKDLTLIKNVEDPI